MSMTAKLFYVVLFSATCIASTNLVQYGKCSYYADKYEGRLCADNKTIFRQKFAYAAHRSLPFGTKIRITNLENGRKWTCVVVDRGPFDYDEALRGNIVPNRTRILDVSKETARMLNFTKQGVCSVKVEIICRVRY